MKEWKEPSEHTITTIKSERILFGIGDTLCNVKSQRPIWVDQLIHDMLFIMLMLLCVYIKYFLDYTTIVISSFTSADHTEKAMRCQKNIVGFLWVQLYNSLPQKKGRVTMRLFSKKDEIWRRTEQDYICQKELV